MSARKSNQLLIAAIFLATAVIAAWAFPAMAASDTGQWVAGTILPFIGAMYASPEKEKNRVAVNQWIRDGNAFDGVIDFDAATRDPADPSKMLPAYDSGDHLHPNDAGYQKMGQIIDLKLFGK